MEFERYETLRFDRRGRVLWITMQGAGSVNAVTRELHEELSRVFYDAGRDPGSDVIVLTGAGKAFCAGGDMTWFQQMIDRQDEFRDLMPEAKRIIHSMLELEKPLVCRLNGDAVGLGASLALLCDLIVANESARIGDPHVKAGLVAADGGSIMWPQLIGYARAKEFLLTGDLLNAPEAARMGLINYAVPAEELDIKINALVDRLLANPRWAVRWTKASINLPLRDIASRVSDAAFAYETLTNATEDRREAVAAFREKRKAQFRGQ
jgi:enoyl-CoA hydratase